jgi:hypothetical protein
VSPKPRFVLVHAAPYVYVFRNVHYHGDNNEKHVISRRQFWGTGDAS